MSAERGMSEWTANGNDYIINDPNNAEEFDPTKDYAVRDHVYHEGILHVFVTPHPAGAWNASHVLAIKVGTELANLWNANDTEATLRANADNDLKSATSEIENAIKYYKVICREKTDSYTTPSDGNAKKKIGSFASENNGKYLVRVTGKYNYNGSSQCTLTINKKGSTQGDAYYSLMGNLVWTYPTSGAFEYFGVIESSISSGYDIAIGFNNAIGNANKATIYDVVMTVVDVTNKTYSSTDEFKRIIDECNGDFIDIGSPKLNFNIVDCFGDSLTAGAGGTPYPTELKALLGNGYEVNNFGVGGESTIAILARLGAIPAYVNPFEITEVGQNKISPVITTFGYGFQPNIRNGRGANPVEIDGVKGNISVSADFSTIYFTRFRYEQTKEVTRPCLIKPHATKYTPFHTMILFMGQNGGWTGSDPVGMLVQQYRQAQVFMKSNNYIFVGLTTGTASSRTNLELAMANNFGGHYFNARDYLVNYGLADNSLTPTSADEAAIAEGSVPPQLMSDSVHLNTYGYSSLAKGIYNHGKGLGMWD